MTAPSRKSIPARAWRRQNICIKRGGQPAARWKGGYERRPYPEKGECPKGYKICGAGSYENGNAVCFDEDEKCPITGILIASDSNPPTSGNWTQSNGTFTVDGYSLYFRREHPDELPIVDFKAALTAYGSDDYLSDGYRPSKNDRGICYIGKTQKYTSSVSVSDVSFASYSISAPSKCKRVDKRYSLYDKARHDELWLGNFQLDSQCSQFDLYPTDHPSYVAANDADYLESGVVCGTSGDYTCDRPDGQQTNCGSSDDICDLVINQNVCGQYAQAARDLANDDNTFGLYYRSEILWLPRCEVNQDQIYTSADPVSYVLVVAAPYSDH